MKHVDVLIIYEKKIRELENCALIAAELNRRGLSTKVLYNYTESIRNRIEAKVVIVPHVYDEWHLEFYSRNAEQSNRNIISMQWEQVLVENTEEDCHNPTGQAKMAQHVAWGRAQVDRYLRHGIDKTHIHEIGCVSMDLFRPEFKDYFLSKEQIAKECGIDPKKEWVLFVSSFSYANRSKEGLKSLLKYDPNAVEFARISDESFTQIVNWLVFAAKSNPNKLFIYRKHPAEFMPPKLKAIEKEVSNFKCIDEYSMRQWSLVADRIYNWYSTSLVDMYFANKSCYILRPVQIPREMDVSIMIDSKHISTYEEFEDSLHSDEYHFPVKEDKIRYYYSNDSKGAMAYEKLADLCEAMIKNPNMGYDFHFPQRSIIKDGLKMIYDYFLYVYAKRFRTSDKVIEKLQGIPSLATLAFKLKLFNQELFGADKLFDIYYNKFVGIINLYNNDNE